MKKSRRASVGPLASQRKTAWMKMQVDRTHSGQWPANPSSMLEPPVEPEKKTENKTEQCCLAVLV